MIGLRCGLGSGMGRLSVRLLAEIAPDRRAGGPDRLAQRLGNEMAVAVLDRNRIDVDDEIGRFVAPGAIQTARGRLRVSLDGGAVEILAPAAVGALEHDDAVDETACSDDVGHSGLAN